MECIDFYGNVTTRPALLYFSAVRFTKPVKIFNTLPKKIPENSIIVLGTKVLGENIEISTNSLVFYSHDINRIKMSDLLGHLFNKITVLYSIFAYDTLFVISTAIPFKFTKKCFKGGAFTALLNMFVDCYMLKKPLTFEHVINLRHFKVSVKDFKNFSGWLPLCQSLFRQLNDGKFTFDPIPKIGAIGHKLLHQSDKMKLGPMPPDDFYTCEVLLDTDVPVGIMFQVTSNNLVQYVSPMVVSYPIQPFRDVNGQVCPYWFPLYQNKHRWRTTGCFFYLQRIGYTYWYIQQILSYLKIRNSEKYTWLYLDFIHVAKLLVDKGIK